MPLLIIDIDGTIADCNHRLHFVRERDYQSFYSPEQILADTPINPVIRLIESLTGWDKILLTGRPESTRKATTEWLTRHTGFANLEMLMRPDGYYISSAELKPWLLRDILPKYEGEDVYAFDDDYGNCEALKNIGITALCVPRD